MFSVLAPCATSIFFLGATNLASPRIAVEFALVLAVVIAVDSVAAV
jgi:hypothetical protein